MLTAFRIATLMGSVSLLSLTTALAAQAQTALSAQTAQTAPPAQMAQAAADQVPEQVLVTGSLIHGAVAIGVPVTNFTTQDFTETGSVFTGELFRKVPAAVVSPGPSAVNGGGAKQEPRHQPDVPEQLVVEVMEPSPAFWRRRKHLSDEDEQPVEGRCRRDHLAGEIGPVAHTR